MVLWAERASEEEKWLVRENGNWHGLSRISSNNVWKETSKQNIPHNEGIPWTGAQRCKGKRKEKALYNLISLNSRKYKRRIVVLPSSRSMFPFLASMCGWVVLRLVLTNEMKATSPLRLCSLLSFWYSDWPTIFKMGLAASTWVLKCLRRALLPSYYSLNKK